MSFSGVLNGFIQVYSTVVFVYVIMSWFRPSGVLWEIYHGLGLVCEPFIGVFRRVMPSTAGIDFSPMVALIVLNFVGNWLVRLLAGMGL